jgi:ribose/xylose/arabinose/galactoside ABC-type transport system permease subunit
VLLLLDLTVFVPGFFHLEIKDGHLYGSLVDILNRAAPLMLAALGMTLVIATRGIDISVGAVVALSGTVAAMLIGGDATGPNTCEHADALAWPRRWARPAVRRLERPAGGRRWACSRSSPR